MKKMLLDLLLNLVPALVCIAGKHLRIYPKLDVPQTLIEWIVVAIPIASFSLIWAAVTTSILKPGGNTVFIVVFLAGAISLTSAFIFF